MQHVDVIVTEMTPAVRTLCEVAERARALAVAQQDHTRTAAPGSATIPSTAAPTISDKEIA